MEINSEHKLFLRIYNKQNSASSTVQLLKMFFEPNYVAAASLHLQNLKLFQESRTRFSINTISSPVRSTLNFLFCL